MRIQQNQINQLYTLVEFLGFAYGFQVLEGNIHAKNGPLNGELVMSMANNYFKNSTMSNTVSREYRALFASKTQKHQVTKN
jgi:hypothetical protein